MSTNSAVQSTASMFVPAHEHATCLHDVQLYSDDAYLLDSLTTFVGREIAKGNSAIVIATKEHRDGLAERLARQYPDLCLAVEQGRYIPLDAADTLSKFMVNGTPDPALFSEVVGATVSRAAAAVRGEHSRVAAYGEMVSLLWAKGEYEAVVRLEQLWNDLSKTHSFALRCGYPLKGFDRKDHSDLFLKICTEHSAVIPDESFTKLANEKERLALWRACSKGSRRSRQRSQSSGRCPRRRSKFRAGMKHSSRRSRSGRLPKTNSEGVPADCWLRGIRNSDA